MDCGDSRWEEGHFLKFFKFLKGFLLFKKNIYIYIFLFREREEETQAEGEAGSMQRARGGTQSWVSRITPQAAGGAKPLHHWGCPGRTFWTGETIGLIF